MYLLKKTFFRGTLTALKIPLIQFFVLFLDNGSAQEFSLYLEARILAVVKIFIPFTTYDKTSFTE